MCKLYQPQFLEKIPKINKCRAFNKVIGFGKKSKIDKRSAYVYSGVQSTDNFLEAGDNKNKTKLRAYKAALKKKKKVRLKLSSHKH